MREKIYITVDYCNPFGSALIAMILQRKKEEKRLKEKEQEERAENAGQYFTIK